MPRYGDIHSEVHHWHEYCKNKCFSCCWNDSGSFIFFNLFPCHFCCPLLCLCKHLLAHPPAFCPETLAVFEITDMVSKDVKTQKSICPFSRLNHQYDKEIADLASKDAKAQRSVHPFPKSNLKYEKCNLHYWEQCERILLLMVIYWHQLYRIVSGDVSSGNSSKLAERGWSGPISSLHAFYQTVLQHPINSLIFILMVAQTPSLHPP